MPAVKPARKAGTPGLRVPASLRPGLLMLISFRPREESRPNWANEKHRDLCEPSPPAVMHRRVADRSAERRVAPGIWIPGARRGRVCERVLQTHGPG